MTIEIQRPELEALIRERMKSGAFHNVEDVLMQALKASPAPEKDAGRSDEKSPAMGSELVEAMQASPFKEIALEPGRERMPVRDAGF
jgi:Arc/MetJ-type ribon-helix-helix transcriptional regulator